MKLIRNTITLALICTAIVSFGQVKKPLSQPLVSHIFTADPSAHVFNGKIYIYPSHDIESGTKEDDEGGHFDMKDYRVLSMDTPQSKVKDNGVALDIKDVKWAGRQMSNAIYQRQKGRCAYCEEMINLKSGWHLHHIVQRIHGGKDTADNLVMLHPNCHTSVHQNKFSFTRKTAASA